MEGIILFIAACKWCVAGCAGVRAALPSLMPLFDHIKTYYEKASYIQGYCFLRSFLTLLTRRDSGIVNIDRRCKHKSISDY